MEKKWLMLMLPVNSSNCLETSVFFLKLFLIDCVLEDYKKSVVSNTSKIVKRKQISDEKGAIPGGNAPHFF